MKMKKYCEEKLILALKRGTIGLVYKTMKEQKIYMMIKCIYYRTDFFFFFMLRVSE